MSLYVRDADTLQRNGQITRVAGCGMQSVYYSVPDWLQSRVVQIGGSGASLSEHARRQSADRSRALLTLGPSAAMRAVWVYFALNVEITAGGNVFKSDVFSVAGRLDSGEEQLSTGMMYLDSSDIEFAHDEWLVNNNATQRADGEQVVEARIRVDPQRRRAFEGRDNGRGWRLIRREM